MKTILLASILALAQAGDIQICTGSGLILSEFYTGLFTDVIRNNANEKFTYNETTQSIIAKTNGQCIELHLFAPNDDAGKYSYGLMRTERCDSANPLQKWVFTENRIMNPEKKLCFYTKQFSHSYNLSVYPCAMSEIPVYSDTYFTDCSKLNADFVRITTPRGFRVSEGNGGVYCNIPMDNFNELFWWNPKTQMFKNPMRGDCLDSYLDVDGKYKIHMYACSEDNPNQKWIVHADTKKIEHATHKGQCLDGDPTYSDRHLQMWECIPNNENQVFAVEKFVL